MTNFVRHAAFLLVALVVAVTALPAFAQQQELAPEHLALARKYVDLTDKSGIYEVALVQTGVETMRTIVTQHPTLIEPVDVAITTTLEGYRARKGELMDQFARLYAMRLSMEELQQIVAFYESPAGAKLATVNATIGNDVQVVMQLFTNNLKTEFYAQVRAELKAAGHDV